MSFEMVLYQLHTWSPNRYCPWWSINLGNFAYSDQLHENQLRNSLNLQQVLSLQLSLWNKVVPRCWTTMVNREGQGSSTFSLPCYYVLLALSTGSWLHWYSYLSWLAFLVWGFGTACVALHSFTEGGWYQPRVWDQFCIWSSCLLVVMLLKLFQIWRWMKKLEISFPNEKLLMKTVWNLPSFSIAHWGFSFSFDFCINLDTILRLVPN